MVISNSLLKILNRFISAVVTWRRFDSKFKENLTKPWEHTSFIAIDLEMTSLDPDLGEIVSIGWVTIDNSQIILSSAHHLIVRTERSVGQSATIHSIKDADLTSGVSLFYAIDALLEAISDKVLIFHNASLDLCFLEKAIKKLSEGTLSNRNSKPSDNLSANLLDKFLVYPVIDTLTLEKQKLQAQDKTLLHNSLTLDGCRSRYGLPKYGAHNALADAIATAELFIAHCRKKGDSVRVKTLISS